MAEAWEEELNRLTADSGAGEAFKELDKITGEAPATAAAPAAPVEDWVSELEKLQPKEPSLGELFTGGFSRTVQDIKNAPEAVGAQIQEIQGDPEGAAARMELLKLSKEAEGLPQEQETFERLWNEPSRIGRYLTEALGEQAPYLLGGLATGGVGSIAGVLGTRLGAYVLPHLVRWTAPTAAKFGATAGIFGGSAVVETAGSGEEFYEATGEVQGKSAIGAGLGKAAIESVGGLSTVGRALVTPGQQLAKKGFTRQLGTTALGEAAQETSQEEVDIQFRAGLTAGQKDPYNAWGTEAWMRRAEAGFLGATLGATVGAPGIALERKQVPLADDESAPGYTSGYSPVEEVARGVKTIPELQAPVPQAVDRSLEDVVHPVDPVMDDPLGLHLQLKQLMDGNGAGQAAVLEALEANTDRYAVVGPDGKAAGGTLYTDTELERYLATRPQGEQAQVVKVDPKSIDLREMSADVFDLPTAESGKVWFLPETSPEKKVELLEKYRMIQQTSGEVVQSGAEVADVNVESVTRAHLEAKLRPLLAEGLRVVPSYGRGFWYNGQFKGTPETPHTTGRTKQLGVYNPNTKSIELSAGYLTQNNKSGIPVALDLRRLKPGDVSGVPVSAAGSFRQLPGWEFRDGVTDAKKAEMFDWLDRNASQTPTAEQMQKLMAEGIWYAPSKGSPALVPRPGLDIRSYTYGVVRDRGLHNSRKTESSIHLESTPGRVKQEKSTLFVEKQPGTILSPEAQKMQSTMARELKKYLPAVDRLLRKYGIYGGVAFNVSTMHSTSVFVESGEIFFNPEEFVHFKHMGMTTGSLEVDINNAVLHELGHLVTFALYKKLPLLKKLKLRSAYHKALLADRLQADTLGHRVQTEITAGKPRHTRYYQSFSEWLAEQFRRHGRTDTEIRNEFELPFKDVANGVKRFYEDWEKTHGAEAAFNLRHPDRVFGAVMQQISDAEKKLAPLRRLEQSQELWRLGDGVTFSPVAEEIIQAAVVAVESVRQLALPNAAVVLGEKLDTRLGPVDPDATARYSQRPGELETAGHWARGANPIAVLELALGALKKKQAYEHSRDVVTQGWMHAYMELGLMSGEEISVLAQGAKFAKIDLGPHTISVVRERAKELGLDDAGTANYTAELMDRMLAAEYVAANVSRFDAPTRVQQILQRIVAILRSIQDRLMDTGYHSQEQLLHAIFKGEIAGRYKNAEANALVAPAPVPQAGGVLHGPANAMVEDITRVVPVDDELHVYVAEYGGKGSAAKEVFYHFYRGPMAASMEEKPETDYVGYVNLKNRKELGYEVGMVEVTEGFRRQGYAGRMHKFWQSELGVQHKPSGELTTDGYSYWKSKNPDMVKYHVYDKNEDLGTGNWLSPRKLEQWIIVTEQALENQHVQGVNRQYWEKKLTYYKNLRKRINKKAWGDPELKRMYMVDPQYAAVDGMQASVTRGGMQADAQKLEDSLSGREGGSTDSFEAQLQHELQWSQAENAEVLGIPFEDSAPLSLASEGIRGLQLGMAQLPPNTRQAMQQVAAQQDRISWFSQIFLGLQQIGWRNEHIPGLQKYVQHVDQMGQRVTAWTTRADETARAWEKLPSARRNAIGEMMFWLAEMRYLSAVEVQNNVTRWPTQAELTAEIARRRLSRTEVLLMQRVQSDFAEFLNDVERVKIQNLQRTILDPQALAAAIAQLRVEMSQLRAKPYFPFVRFGRHTITVRDSAGKVVWFSAYETASERNREMPRVAARFPTGSFIQKGMVPEEAAQFMGLPPPLISHIKATMPNLSAAQSEWLDSFAAAHLPGNSFRRRFLKKEGTSGFSMDAFRAYAHYFTTGSRYLARLEFDIQLREDIAEVQDSTVVLQDNTKRVQILDMMQKHYKYITNDPKDFSRWRAFTALFHLGFSPVAAGMNLTQIVTVLSPYLRSTFGTVSARTMQNTFKMMRRGSTTKGLSPTGLKAHKEMVDQGRIQVGQASELASFAEGTNLVKMMAGTKVQKAYRQLSYYGMFMFSQVERFNRELSFRCAWDLAIKNPNVKRLQEIGLNYPIEIADLIQRLGFSHQEAVAFLYAREAIDRTQGNYSPWARPQLFRNRWTNATGLMFLQYIQMLMYALRFNGATVQMLLIMLLLYGLKGGIPGEEDLNETIKFLAEKLFGEDFDINRKAQEYVADMMEGTGFDTVGPDLMMHGLSRYGFGVGLLPDGWYGPRFDVSANGSVGKLIPGVTDVLRSFSWKSDWEGASTGAMKALGGAGMSPLFNLLQFFAEPPGTVNSHRWESALPRTMRDAAKAYRFSTEGETTRQGGRIVQFDWSDPEDAATLLASYLGLKPTKVTRYWEGMQAQQDSIEVYEARKMDLYGQAYQAFKSQEEGAMADVQAAIIRYNEDVRATGATGMEIDAKKLKASIKAREAVVQKQEAGLPQKKSHYGVHEKVKKLYPELGGR